MSICLIDGQSDLKRVMELCPYADGSNINMVGRKNSVTDKHGTLCMALLVEALHNNNILQDVEITHVSISNSHGEMDYKLLLAALEYCAKKHPDFISASVGTFYCNRGMDMIASLNLALHHKLTSHIACNCHDSC